VLKEWGSLSVQVPIMGEFVIDSHKTLILCAPFDRIPLTHK
jgi:hypothetical protein